MEGLELYVGSKDGVKDDCQAAFMTFWIDEDAVTRMETSRGIIDDA